MDEITTDHRFTTKPLTHEDRIFDPTVEGVPIVLADGATWMIPRSLTSTKLNAERDEIADAYWNGRGVRDTTFQGVTLALMLSAYNANPEELAPLIAEADQGNLLTAVKIAIVGNYPNQDVIHTHSEWIMSGLFANGINPKTVPSNLIEGIVKHLVETGRMAQPWGFITSAYGMRKRGEAIGMITGDGN